MSFGNNLHVFTRKSKVGIHHPPQNPLACGITVGMLLDLLIHSRMHLVLRETTGMSFCQERYQGDVDMEKFSGALQDNPNRSRRLLCSKP